MISYRSGEAEEGSLVPAQVQVVVLAERKSILDPKHYVSECIGDHAKLSGEGIFVDVGGRLIFNYCWNIFGLVVLEVLSEVRGRL